MTFGNLPTYYLFYAYSTLGAARGADRGTPSETKAILLTTTIDNLSASFYFMLTRHWAAA
jgi:hypothetical protein